MENQTKNIENIVKDDKLANIKVNLGVYAIQLFGTGLLAGYAVENMLAGDYNAALLDYSGGLIAGIMSYYTKKDLLKGIDKLGK